MGKLIIRLSGSLFIRNRRYLINVDGEQAGTLTFRIPKLELSLPDGIYVITIADPEYSVIETVQIGGENKTIDIYPCASQMAINTLLFAIILVVLATFLLFLNNGQAAVQLLIFIILLPLCLVILTSRKKTTASFMVLIS